MDTLDYEGVRVKRIRQFYEDNKVALAAVGIGSLAALVIASRMKIGRGYRPTSATQWTNHEGFSVILVGTRNGKILDFPLERVS